MPTVTELQTCELAPTSSECELVQARISTQYYVQYVLDILLIVVVIALFIKIVTWKNWLSEVIKR